MGKFLDLQNFRIYLMEYLNIVARSAEDLIRSKQFFYYHGVVLASLWFVAAVIAIQLRKYSRTLHVFCFFCINITTMFFIFGALLRVYPQASKFSRWPLLKQAHVAGGIFFLVLLVLQHILGVTALLKNYTYFPIHRTLGLIVSNLARFLAVFGLILGKFDKRIVIGSAVLALVLLVWSVRKRFRGAEKKE